MTMKKRTLAACLLTGFFSLLSAPALAQGGAEAAPLKVYAAGEISVDRYTVVKRLWTGDLRSMIYAPTYPTSGEGITALVDAANAAGANGMVNVYCVDEAMGRSESSAFLCYGLAVKTK
jgi:uncharacterized protein YbjQ (UPF0145 family)